MAAMLPMACSQFAIPGWASHQPSALDREPLIHTIQSILVVYRRRRRLAIVVAPATPPAPLSRPSVPSFAILGIGCISLAIDDSAILRDRDVDTEATERVG